MKQNDQKAGLQDRRDGIIRLISGIIVVISLFGFICTAATSSTQSDSFNVSPQVVLHQSDIETSPAEPGPTVSEELESATLVLTRPPDMDRVAYTERNFSSSEEASIAWWKAPAFMDNTSEFRGYQRADSGKKAEYDEDKQIFYNFIQDCLDAAENQSVAGSDLILFRGIGSSFAGTVLNNSEYREAAFASTSYDPVVSLDVFGPADAEGYHNLLVLERKAGEHVLFVNEDEREYLIPRGSDWQVVKSVAIDNLTIEADFPLYNRTGMTDSFSNVRFIYITPVQGDL